MGKPKFERHRNAAIYEREFEEGSALIALWRSTDHGGIVWKAEVFVNGSSIVVVSRLSRTEAYLDAITYANGEIASRAREETL